MKVGSAEEKFGIKQELSTEDEFFEYENQHDTESESSQNNNTNLDLVFLKGELLEPDDDLTIFNEVQEDIYKKEQLILDEEAFISKQKSVSDVNHEYGNCLHSQINTTERIYSSEKMQKTGSCNYNVVNWDELSENCNKYYMPPRDKKSASIFTFCGFDSESDKLNDTLSLFSSSDEESQPSQNRSRSQVKFPIHDATKHQECESLMQDSKLPTRVAGILEGSDKVTYKIKENATLRGMQRLIDSNGHSYAMNRKILKRTNWRCSSRNKKVCWGASFVQSSDNMFFKGPLEHCHHTPFLALESAEIISAVKSQAAIDPSIFAFRIAQNVVVKNAASDSPASGKLKPDYFAKKVNDLQESQLFTSSNKEGTSQPILELSKIQVIVPSLEAHEHQTHKSLSLRQDSELSTRVTNILKGSDNITYKIKENATRKGGQRLIGSDGYSYTKGKKSSRRKNWQCSTRNRNVNCRATVVQNSDNMFFKGPLEHCHPAPLLALESAKIISTEKSQAVLDSSKMSFRITQNVVVKRYAPDSPAAGKLKPDYLAKIVNDLQASHLFTSSNKKDTSQPILELSKIQAIVPSLEIHENQAHKSLSLRQDCELSAMKISILKGSDNITYKIEENATRKGGQRLIGSDGYSYTEGKKKFKKKKLEMQYKK